LSEKLRSRTQKSVREAIHCAALYLFVADSFDNTAIKEVAEVAWVLASHLRRCNALMEHLFVFYSRLCFSPAGCS
jgi:hypothetical protein